MSAAPDQAEAVYPVESRRAPALPRWALFLPIVVRLVVLAFDRYPYLFLWDSIDYLLTGSPNWNRPFGYSLFVIVCRELFGGSLLSVVWIQSALGVATAYACYRIAATHLGMPNGPAVGVYLCVGLWPVNLLYEHAILSEALFSFVLAIALLCTLRAMRDGRGWVPLAFVLAALPLIRSLGLVLIPIALGAILLGSRDQSARRRLATVTRTTLVVLSILIPYMSLQMHRFNEFNLVMYRGRAMFPYTFHLHDAKDVEEPWFRELLERDQHSLRAATSEEIRWPKWEGSDNRLLTQIMANTGTNDVRVDPILSRLAERAILQNPIGYARLVSWEAAKLVLDTGGTPSSRRLFQSADGLRRLRWQEADHASGVVGGVLRARIGYSMPEASGAQLHALVSTAFEGRLMFFVMAGALLIVVLRRGRCMRGVVVLVLFLLVLTFIPILLQEYYGRYFVPAINMFFLLLAFGLAAIAPRARPILVAGALAIHVTLSAAGWPLLSPATWDMSHGGGRGSGAMYRASFAEIPAASTGPDGGTALEIRGGVGPGPGSAIAVIPSDPDGDGTPPDDVTERWEGWDLTNGIAALVFDVRGDGDVGIVRFALQDSHRLITSTRGPAPALDRYLPEGHVAPDRWHQVRIPLRDFPRHDDRVAGWWNHAGVVDLTSICAVVIELVQPSSSANERREVSLRIANLRFVGERELRWSVRDDTSP